MPYDPITYEDHFGISKISKIPSQCDLKPYLEKHKTIPRALKSAQKMISPTPKAAQHPLASIHNKNLQERDHLPLQKPNDHLAPDQVAHYLLLNCPQL